MRHDNGRHLTQFNPTIRIVQPDDEPDLLAGAVLNSLTRPMHRGFAIGIVPAFAFTLLTIGIAPVLSMTRRLRMLIVQQEQQLWHLAEWMRLQTGDAEAIELQKSSQQIRFNMPLALLTGLFVLIAVCAIGMHFTGQPFVLREMYRFAFRFPATPEAVIFAFSLPAAAVCNWAHLAWHQQNIERYVRWFNHLASRQNLQEIALPPIELGLRPLWIVTGLLISLTGALWALPVMLAAAAHRRYIRVGSPKVRAALAERLRAMLLARRPMMRVPKPVAFVRNCLRPNCRSPMPTSASFCPRCGTRAARAMDVVA
jgi:hypothetical protein